MKYNHISLYEENPSNKKLFHLCKNMAYREYAFVALTDSVGTRQRLPTSASSKIPKFRSRSCFTSLTVLRSRPTDWSCCATRSGINNFAANTRVYYIKILRGLLCGDPLDRKKPISGSGPTIQIYKTMVYL